MEAIIFGGELKTFNYHIKNIILKETLMTQKILLFSNLFLICALVSCNKDSTNQVTTSSSVEYKVNGSSFSISEYVVFAKQGSTRYLFNAQKGVNNIVLFSVLTDSLKTISYHYDSSAINVGAVYSIVYDGQNSSVLKKNDYFDISITDYSNGHVSGTFTAKLTPINSSGTTGTPSSITITEGKLNNVQVIY
jgi:hypothetical protein